MPCYTMQTTEISIAGLETEELADALRAMGFDVSISGGRVSFRGKYKGRLTGGSYANGEFSLLGKPDTTEFSSDVKVNYNSVLVKKKLAPYLRSGWTLTKTDNTYRKVTL